MYCYSYENLKRIANTEKGKNIVRQAQEIYDKDYANVPILALRYSLYKLFKIDGNRNKFESMYFDRRKRLRLLQVLALSDDSYIEPLEDVLATICDEYTWVLPAHAHHTDLDLFSAETSFYLAETAYIFKEKLSVDIVERIHKSLEEKIVKVFESHRLDWEIGSSNWSAVCACGVGVTYLYAFPERFPSVEERLLQDFETYLQTIDEEGYCEEGVTYWQYGFGFFALFFDLYTQLTEKNPAILQTKKVQNLVRYMYNAQMDETVYLPFADGGSKRFLADGQILSAIKNLFGDAFEVDLTSKLTLMQGNSKALGCRLLNGVDKFLLDTVETLPKCNTCYYGKGQVFIHKNQNYAFAVKGGHNGELHNHNDIGSFQIVKNGKRLLTDIGAGEYTRQYFSKERYTIFVCSSLSHSVPILNGKAQEHGAQYCGDVLEQTDTLFKMNIAKAYENLADSLIVTYQMEEKGVRIRYQAKGLNGTTIFRFVSDYKPAVCQDGKVCIEDALTITHTHNLIPSIERKEYTGHIRVANYQETVDGKAVRINNVEEAWIMDYAMQGNEIETEFYFEIL